MGQMKKLAEQVGQEQPKPETEAKKPATFALAMKGQLEGARDQIMKALPEHIDAERFIMVALTAITRNDALQECGLPSVYLAVMECARLGLFPDNREAAIIPYKGVATLQPMVQGITRLMLRSPGLLKVEARAVFEGDDFDFRYGLEPDLRHKPALKTETVTHAYAILWRQGTEPTFEVVGRDEIERARLTSRAPDSPAWKHWYGEMARKVAVKRLGKYADLSPEATRAIDVDNLVSGDPWAGAEPEGVSPEYRNQMVRAQTLGGIERLKERMGADMQPLQEHPPLEAEVGQVQPGAPAAELDQGPARQFTPALLDELVKTGLAPDRGEAALALGRSPWAHMTTPLRSRKPVVEWLRAYNSFVDEGEPRERAAARATARIDQVYPAGGEGEAASE